MTIHHDKSAYGKLEESFEEISEEDIAKMLEELNGEEQDGKNCCDKDGGEK